MKKQKLPTNLVMDRAEKSIAHGALTNSKRPSCFVRGIYPTHLNKGSGCHVWDTDGRKYIDFICGLGSNLIGYANIDLINAMVKRANLGTTLSFGTELEVETAEKLKEIFPFIERLRFLKNGSDACSAAIRIARAYTRKHVILSDGYHGCDDAFVSLTPPAFGIEHPKVLGMGKLKDDSDFTDVAAVIIEPMITDFSTRRVAYLKELREKCTKHGVLLIFDEIITGFRFPGFSVSNDYCIQPDLICLGKALAGGMPLSVVGGSETIMETDYFISNTANGETLSLASALKTMQLLQTKHKLDDLWEKGSAFLFRFNEIWRDGLTLEGYPTRSILKGDELTKALFMQECCKSGIIIGTSFFFIFPHIEIVDEVISIFSDIMRNIRLKQVKLEGEMPQAPLAQQIRSNKNE